jgi:hypothetical protein
MKINSTLKCFHHSLEAWLKYLPCKGKALNSNPSSFLPLKLHKTKLLSQSCYIEQYTSFLFINAPWVTELLWIKLNSSQLELTDL